MHFFDVILPECSMYTCSSDFKACVHADAQHHTAPIVLAANSPSESRLVIDIISAFKLYRTVADAHSGSPEVRMQQTLT